MTEKIKYQKCLKNKTVAVPFNNDPNLISGLSKLLISPLLFRISIYFAANPLIFTAGRRLPGSKNFIGKNKNFQSDKFDKMLVEALKEAKKCGFKTNLLLNNILLGMVHDNKKLVFDIQKIQNYLEKLYRIGCLDKITIGNPYLLELVNWNRLKNIEIKTSVNFQIKDAKTIEMLNILSDNWLEKKRLTTIEIQKDLLRDIKTLKEIKKAIKNKIKLSIIINEGCITSCPYQLAHQIHAFTTPTKALFGFDKDFKFALAKCKYITCSAPWKIFDSNWILPKHLKYYRNLIDEFKLTDRNDSTETILNTVKAYVSNEYDKENLCKLISLLNMEKFLLPESILGKDFFRKITSDKKPDDRYYKTLWQKVIAYNKNKGKEVGIKIKGLQKSNLHRFIGNN